MLLHPLIAYRHMLLFLTKLHSPSHLLTCSRTINHVILSAICFQFALRSPFTSRPSADFHQLRLSVKLSLKLLALRHRFKVTLPRHNMDVNHKFSSLVENSQWNASCSDSSLISVMHFFRKAHEIFQLYKLPVIQYSLSTHSAEHLMLV